MELLVVISILGLLAAMLVVYFNTARHQARFVGALTEMKRIALAAKLYYSNSNAWPADVNPGVAVTDFIPAYMSKWPEPACPGWTYDWDNWYNGDVIRITLRSSNTADTDENSVFYYCLYEATNQGCASQGNSYGGGGNDIADTNIKEITCQETKYP